VVDNEGEGPMIARNVGNHSPKDTGYDSLSLSHK